MASSLSGRPVQRNQPETPPAFPTIAFDLAAMQNSLIGASGERLRAAAE